MGAFPAQVAITPNGAFAYVVNILSDNVSVISIATNIVVATVPGLRLFARGRKAQSSCYLSSRLHSY